MTGEQWSQIISLLIGGLVTIAVEALRRLQKQRNAAATPEALGVVPPSAAPATPGGTAPPLPTPATPTPPPNVTPTTPA